MGLAANATHIKVNLNSSTFAFSHQYHHSPEVHHQATRGLSIMEINNLCGCGQDDGGRNIRCYKEKAPAQNLIAITDNNCTLIALIHMDNV